MKSFVQFLDEMSTADQITAGFKALGGATGAGVSEMTEKYAQRILAGEDPNQVLAGQRPNGAVWTSVMNRVKQLQQQSAQPAPAAPAPAAAPQAPPAAAPAGPQQLSVSRLENEFGIKPGRLELVDGGQHLVVKNKMTGKKVFVKKDGNVLDGVHRAIAQVFMQQQSAQPAPAAPAPAAAPQAPPAAAPAGPQQLSVSRLENEFGIKPGRLELVDGGQHLVVKNKMTGKKVFVKKDGNVLDGVHRAIAQVFM
jgi:hypothetical protein